MASDLDCLRREYMLQLSETTVLKEGYYPFYATIGHRDFAWGIARMRQDIQSAKNKDGADERGAARENRDNQRTSARFENLRLNEDVRVALHRLFTGKKIVCPSPSYEGKMLHMAFFRVEEGAGEVKVPGKKCKDSRNC
jgi:hypothetical protein